MVHASEGTVRSLSQFTKRNTRSARQYLEALKLKLLKLIRLTRAIYLIILRKLYSTSSQRNFMAHEP